MSQQNEWDYQRIANAIEYIQANFKSQPSLYEVAEEVHVSPFHFQRLFTEWAGTSPKKFLQYTSLEYAKKLLKENGATLSDVSFETGLSGTGRLHDLFINLEGMTPAEYRDGGKNLIINYHFSQSPFGDLLVASTSRGICHLAFFNKQAEALEGLKSRFPQARFQQETDDFQLSAIAFLQNDSLKPQTIKLHVKGSGFQLKVWEALLKIPMGQLSTYSAIAQNVGNPNASRAVGTAIGSNPVAFLIPCHRVIQSSGHFGGYRWGPTRKTAIIGWEMARLDQESETVIEQEGV